MGKKSVEDRPLLKDNDGKQSEKALSTAWASLYIIGEQIGAGSLALPYTIAIAGWTGVLLIVIIGILSAYSAVILGNCWIIVHQKCLPDENEFIRNPYPYLGERAIGVWFRKLLSVINSISLLGSCTVLLLLAAQNSQALINNHTSVSVSYCYWILIIIAVLVPLSWFRSPKDFWLVAILATVSILLAIVIIITLSSINIIQYGPFFETSTSALGIFLAVGTICFAFSGATATYPLIQQDMKDPSEFSTAVIIATVCMGSLYGLVAVVGYVAIGPNVGANISVHFPPGGAKIASEVAVVIHLMTAFLLIINTVMQDLESFECFQVPHEFSWKRALIRTSVLLVIAFFGESIPNFSGLLALVGGSTLSFISYIAPCIIYWKLCTTKDLSQSVNFPTISRVLCSLTIIVGVIGGVAATYSAVVTLMTTTFIPPCYVNITAASEAQNV